MFVIIFSLFYIFLII